MVRPRLHVPVSGVAGEVASTARFVATYPLGVAEAALTTGRPSADATHDTPVLLVHGYAHNQSGWWAFDRYLRRQGHTSIHRLNYLPIGSGVPALADRVAGRVDEILRVTGASRIHVIGHSLGGVLLRWYVEELGGDARVSTAITLGTPHQGTVAAYLWPERTARHLRPGSWVMRRLEADATPSPVRWVSVWSDADLLVQPHDAARLTAPGLDATNVAVHGIGHLSLLAAPQVMHVAERALAATTTAAA